MERFVFIAAVTFAIIFGVGAVFGHGHWGIEWDDSDGLGTSPVVAVAAGRMEAQAFQGAELRIKNAAARVTVTPEDRQDFLIEIDNPGSAPMPNVSSDEGRVVIDGQLRGRIGNCQDDGGAELRGYGEVAADRLPRIVIHAPRALTISRGGAGTTEIGATESLDLDFSGCGSATFADVAGALSLDVAGSGRVQGAAARSLEADVAGSGDVRVGAVADGANVDIAGSGEVTIAALNGELGSDGAGSGHLTIEGGAVTTAKIELAGSGEVDIAAPVQRLDVSIMGSGDVDVQGEVGDIEAEIAGSGSVNARSVTGSVHKDIVGSGEVNVGG